MRISLEKKELLDVLKVPLALLVAWSLIWVSIFQDTLSSVYSVWMISEVYTHCLFVVPVSLYFAYDRWPSVLAAAPKPSYIAVILMFLLQGVWLLGYAAEIQVFKHAAVFGMLSCSVIMFFGWGIAKILWFPLSFVVFAIPIGEELVPYLQVITSDMSVQLLKWTGVPVYQDGLFISIPEGMFEVAEACSGVRFFVACVVMGAIISYVSYVTLWKRLAFFALSFVLPVLANSVRVYGTILIGHFIDMKYASEADHIIYGWGFFAFVVLILVACSRVGAEESAQNKPSGDVNSTGNLPLNDAWSRQRWLPVAALAALPIVMTYAIYQGALNEKSAIKLYASGQPGETIYPSERTPWVPVFHNPAFRHLGQSDTGFDFFIAGYESNKPGSELISDANRLFDIKKWRYISSEVLHLKKGSDSVSFRVGLLYVGTPNGKKRAIAYWYRLPNFSSSSGLRVKLAQAMNLLQQKGTAGAVIALSIPYVNDPEPAKAELILLVTQYAAELESMIIFE